MGFPPHHLTRTCPHQFKAACSTPAEAHHKGPRSSGSPRGWHRPRLTSPRRSSLTSCRKCIHYWSSPPLLFSGGSWVAAALGGLEIPHGLPQSQVVLLTPHQGGTKQGRRSNQRLRHLGCFFSVARARRGSSGRTTFASSILLRSPPVTREHHHKALETSPPAAVHCRCLHSTLTWAYLLPPIFCMGMFTPVCQSFGTLADHLTIRHTRFNQRTSLLKLSVSQFGFHHDMQPPPKLQDLPPPPKLQCLDSFGNFGSNDCVVLPKIYLLCVWWHEQWLGSKDLQILHLSSESSLTVAESHIIYVPTVLVDLAPPPWDTGRPARNAGGFPVIGNLFISIMFPRLDFVQMSNPEIHLGYDKLLPSQWEYEIQSRSATTFGPCFANPTQQSIFSSAVFSS